MQTEITRTEQEARRLHLSAWFVLAGGVLLSVAAWWQVSAPDGAPMQSFASALLMSGAAGSVILWWLLRLWAQRHR